MHPWPLFKPMSQGPALQTLPGFRDFYPEECAARNYIFAQWRETCRRYGFHEYEGPILESTDLYRKKSGDEIVDQLFAFEDKGERDVSMRPELTPTLARMIHARQRDFKKPMRWFSIGPFFRYERAQITKGRLREFYQFNCDIVGETAEGVDSEIISLAIDLMHGFGFDRDDFVVRISDRDAWLDFAKAQGISEEQTSAFLQCIDKMEREKEDVTAKQLQVLGTSLETVRQFIADGTANVPRLERLMNQLNAQGKDQCCVVDLGIVRGLAYYSGVVFEIFDKKHGLRAIAGGGRYDGLIRQLCGGKVDIPAAGFGMGDAVIGNLIDKGGEPKSRLTEYVDKAFSIDAYVVVASESKRPQAIAGVQLLRDAGLRVHYPYGAAKVGKQFKAAESHQAAAAIVFGDEFPSIGVKNLVTRSEITIDSTDTLVNTVLEIVNEPHPSPLLA
jgi:histidyl-tRNA synthetase